MPDFIQYEVEEGQPDLTVFETDKYVFIVCDGDKCGIIWQGRNDGLAIPYPIELIDLHVCPK